tara:strand:+ start:111 stop:371 length:261 start_codon:yes stop_codon:yes gene_type:complete
MTKAEEILEKHLANNIDQRTYLRGSKLTYNICIDALNEAINYTRCCADMNDKIIKLLDDWKVNKHKQELMAEELLILSGVVKSFTA